MTKSTITRERVVALIAEHSYDSALVDALEHLLAAMDSEPVAWTDEQELRDVDRGGCGYLFTVNPVTPHADERRIILLYRHAQLAPASPVCTCPSGDGSLRWPCQVHPGSSPVIPDGSAAMLRRWLAFGRGMQNAGSQLPHNLIAETESMLAATPQEVKGE
ncbi:Uncharacterised protein [Klebsiella quasipneumoniae]|uniref:hypothetical protein n=1 Tax=Klebsiella quasipneumoniae TaxID=1463165 RepID=UPI000DE61F28|nr:hypothetical protein [Klebsiella quasipneumoniae]SSG14130.1 Uncharacterised protein [Klebsiella quasipneumoniae]SSH01179.1 Uncharacterised protein [Klebsiella quasipneumoniae]